MYRERESWKKAMLCEWERAERGWNVLSMRRGR